MIAPAIHIHNRKHISHSTSRIKTYLATLRQSISPQRHHAIPTAPLPGGQSESPTEIRGVYGYHVRARRPTCPYGNLTDICHSVQVRSDDLQCIMINIYYILFGANGKTAHATLVPNFLQLIILMYLFHL